MRALAALALALLLVAPAAAQERQTLAWAPRISVVDLPAPKPAEARGTSRQTPEPTPRGANRPRTKPRWYKNHRVWSTAAYGVTTTTDILSSEAAIERGAEELNPVYRLPGDFHSGRRIAVGVGVYGLTVLVDKKWGPSMGSMVRYVMSAIFAAATVHNYRANR